LTNSVFGMSLSVVGFDAGIGYQSPCGREVAMDPPTQFAAMTAQDDVRASA
jgi:hypothetical protein